MRIYMNVLLALVASISLNASEMKDSENVRDLGRNEVLALPLGDLAEFLWNRYYRGPAESFHYYGANPNALSSEQAKRPATILIHASESNQGEWIRLLKAMHEADQDAPLFTFNYKDGDELSALMQKMEEIQKLYEKAGEEKVTFDLVGHSLGGIAAAEYAFSPEIWLKNTHVEKVVTIAARLKNIEDPEKTPFYSYCKDVIRRLEVLWPKIEANRGNIDLYTIAAANDWLVPEESTLVGKDDSHKAIIPEVGHVIIAQTPLTDEQIIKWLF